MSDREGSARPPGKKNRKNKKNRKKRAWVPTGPGDAPLAKIDLKGGTKTINQRQLRRNGLAGWQAPTTAGLLAALELSPRKGAFLDIGANAGIYSLLCKRLWPEMTVIAFEPVPITRRAGLRLAAANEVDIKFESLALSDRTGPGVIYLSSISDASNSLVEGFREPAGTVEVELTTLDAYVKETGVVPSVMKVDVELHEPAVLIGARKTLKRHKPAVVVEMLTDDDELSEAARDAHELLTKIGYEGRLLANRDWLYWHRGIPEGFDDRFADWAAAVARCVPISP